jgi:hypothetical protein
MLITKKKKTHDLTLQGQINAIKKIHIKEHYKINILSINEW